MNPLNFLHRQMFFKKRDFIVIYIKQPCVGFFSKQRLCFFLYYLQ